MIKSKKQRSNKTEDAIKIILDNNDQQEQPKVHNLKSLDSFSKSSESLVMSVSSIAKNDPKPRSASRSTHIKGSDKVSRDVGESFMDKILKPTGQSSTLTNFDENLEEKLRLQNIRMESKVKQLMKENEEILYQRNEFRKQLELLKDKDKLEEVAKNYENKYELKAKTVLEMELKSYNLEVEVNKKSRELKSYNDDIENLNKKLINAEMSYLKVNESYQERCSIVDDLKRQLTELYSENQMYKINLDSNSFQTDNLQQEVIKLQKQRSIFEGQISRLNESRDILKSEVNKLQLMLLEEKKNSDKLSSTNQSLCLQIRQIREIQLKDMSGLLRKLEESQNELSRVYDDREMFEKELSLVSKKLEEKSIVLDQELSKNKSLTDEKRELLNRIEQEELEMSSLKRDLELHNNYIVELRKEIGKIEGTLFEKLEMIKQIELEKDELLKNNNNLTQNISMKSEEICQLNQSLMELRKCFEGVNKEKKQALLGLEDMRKKIDEVEEHFEKTKYDLYNKEESLKLSEELNEELKGKWDQELANVKQKEDLIEEIFKEKYLLIDQLDAFKKLQEQYLEEIEKLRECLNMANRKVIELETNQDYNNMENNRLNGIIEKKEDEYELLVEEIKQMNEKLVELKTLEERFDQLNGMYDDVKSKYEKLQKKHEDLRDKFDRITSELKKELEITKEDLGKLVEEKEVKGRELEKVKNESKSMMSEIENIKFNYVIELSNRDEEYHNMVEQNRRELSQIVQEKIRCENAIDKLHEHIKEMTVSYNDKIREVTGKMLGLERESSEYRQYEEQSKKLKEELERKQGQLDGIMESWTQYKMYVLDLESEVSVKEVEISDVVRKLEEVERDNELKQEKIENLEKMMGVNKNELVDVTERLNEVKDMLMKKGEDLMELDNIRKENECLLGRLDEVKSGEMSNWKLCEELKMKLLQSEALNRELCESNAQLQDDLTSREKLEWDNAELSEELGSIKHKNQLQLGEYDDRLSNLMSSNRGLESLVQQVSQDRDEISRQLDLSRRQDVIARSILQHLHSNLLSILRNNDSINNNGAHDDSNLVSISRDEIQQIIDCVYRDYPSIDQYKHPLGRLNSCIEDLRSQIDSIQSDIAQQMSEAIQ